MMIPRPPPVPVPPQVWPTLTLPNVWYLGAQSGKVRTAAAAWGDLAGRLADGRDDVDTLALALRGDAWSGDASDAYHAHRTALGVSVDDTATAARTAEGALYTAASALTTAQTALSASLATLRPSVHTVIFGPVIWVRPESAEETATVRSLVRGAYDIRDDHDGDPGTADQLDPDHDHAATENALREEIGYPRRDTY